MPEWAVAISRLLGWHDRGRFVLVACFTYTWEYVLVGAEGAESQGQEAAIYTDWSLDIGPASKMPLPNFAGS